jgi:hypothetical protein
MHLYIKENTFSGTQSRRKCNRPTKHILQQYKVRKKRPLPSHINTNIYILLKNIFTFQTRKNPREIDL